MTRMIPNELKEALEKKSFALIIKGPPGSGKTTLALTIAKEYPDRTIYISSRAGINELINQFPWISKLIEKKSIYEAIISRFPREPKEFRIQYTNSTKLIEQIYMLAQEKAGDKTIIIIDSMNAIKEFLDIPEDSLEIEKALMNLVDSYGFNIIFILETEKESKLDYLADGVITLAYSVMDSGILRKIIINKLRGIKTNEVEFLFTLSENEFILLSKIPMFFKLDYTNLPKIDILKRDSFQLKFNLGLNKEYTFQVPLGTSILIEVDPNIPFRYFFITDLIGINLIRQGYTWFLGSALHYDVDRIYQLLKLALPDYDNLSKQFIGIIPQHQEVLYKRLSREIKLFKVTPDVNETTNMLISEIEESNRRSFYLTLIPDIFETTFSENKLIDFIERLMRITSIYKSLAIFISFSTFKQIDYLKGLFEYHFKFNLINGVMVARLLKPIKTPYYGIIFEKIDGFPNLRIYPII